MLLSQTLTDLGPWLQRQPTLGEHCKIASWSTPKTGFSADTLLIDLQDCLDESESRKIVVRVERTDRNTFLDASIVKQAQMLERLSSRGIPAPSLIGWEDDASIIGASFLVMDHVSGQSLPMHPSYHRAGVLIQLDANTRRDTWIEAITTIARINRLSWERDFMFLHEPRYGEPGLSAYVSWLTAWYARACAGQPHPVIEAAITYLKEHQPTQTHTELLWGDSNPGNFLFRADGGVAAVLDFEASSIGPAEIDLSWWFFIDAMVAGGHPLPDGMPNRDEQIAAFESALGRDVTDLDYFARLSGVRMSLVMAQTIRNLVADGLLPASNRGWLANPASSLLAEMLGLNDPGSQDDYHDMVVLMNQR